ncbi:rRNA maturation RNase YbeY [Brevibacterium sp. CFH 10365]|uniref:rRNA maturation RNase YbeY n=1 Tax=Brevibacterium sp. CFH 10365 TaxID=2585207 RepID=UPI00126643DB|nr:rRNA maturation RNase YbeY [Brevibacterium sp. CFH 10365]
MNTEILNETEAEVDLDEVVALTEYLGEALHMHPGAELAVTMVDSAAMSELHVTWMDLEGPTDVMSFPMDQLHRGEPDDPSEGQMGDVIICPEVAESQARAAGHSTMDEILLLTVHGFLHLLGYDHGEPEEREEMFALQRHLLLTFFAARYDGRTDIPTPTEV